jgi:hypothetical protein
MLHLIVVSVILFDWNFDSFLNVVHVSVEVRDILNVADGLRDVQGLLLVDDLFDLLDLGGAVLDDRASLGYV